jgi:hypothetical protein
VVAGRSAREIKLTILGDAQSAVNALGQVNQGAGRLAGIAGRAGLAVAGLGVAAGVAAAGGLAASVLKFTENGDAIDEMASRTGFGTEALSELAHAANLSGGSIEGLEAGVRRMQRTIFDAESGMQSAVDSLDALGVSSEMLQGLSPEEQFNLLTGALAEVEDASTRAALAQELFGRQGTSLLPMLEDGAAGLEAMRAEAHELGIVFSEEDAAAAAQFADVMDKAKARLSGFMFDIARNAIPVLLELGEWIGPRLSAAVDVVLPIVQSLATRFVGFATEAGATIQAFVQGTAIPLFEALSTRVGEELAKWGGFYEADVKPALDNIVAGVQAVVGFISDHWPQIMLVVGPVLAQMQNIIETVFGVIQNVIAAVVNAIAGDWEGAWAHIQEVGRIAWDGIQATIRNGLDLLSGILANAVPLLLEAATTVGGAIGRGILNGLEAAGDAAISLAQQLANALIGIVNTHVIDAVNSALEFTVPLPFGQEFTVNAPDFPHIPQFADGGWVGGGPAGTPHLAVVHTGERVLTAEEAAAGMTVVNQFNIAGHVWTDRELEEFIVRAVARGARHGTFRGTPIHRGA